MFMKFETGVDQALTVLPPLEALTERLHFNLQEGLIWLDDRRILTLGADWLADLRRELIFALGTSRARGVLTRLGYGAGCRDAQMALRLHGNKGMREVILAGIQFHALQGSTNVVPTFYELDEACGRVHLEFEWRNSVEDHIHLQHAGQPGEAGCWMEIGYSSGFLTTCLGRQIVVREVHCKASGSEHCQCVARPSEEWSDVEEDLQYFQSPSHNKLDASDDVPLVNRTAVSMAMAAADEDATTIVGRSAAFLSLRQRLDRVAHTDVTVLLLGESGVGKSALAHELHQQSQRAGRPFVEINCAAIPETLVESELFGVEKGAYTGAQANRIGRFEQADGGAIFLDEIATLSLTAQGKILRVLQNQEFERLGSNQTRRVDVRIIAATNEDLEQAVRDGRFRLDLFYRLNVVPLKIPPLRERREDLPVMLNHFLRRYCGRHGTPVTGFTARALRALLNHDWPGNIRELENVIERGVILADPGEAIDQRHLFTVSMAAGQKGLLSLAGDGTLTADTKQEGDQLTESTGGLELLLAPDRGGLKEVERTLVRLALERAAGNVAQAARDLKITRAQLDYRVKKMGLNLVRDQL